jgi:hypothetical protein
VTWPHLRRRELPEGFFTAWQATTAHKRVMRGPDKGSWRLYWNAAVGGRWVEEILDPAEG